MTIKYFTVSSKDKTSGTNSNFRVALTRKMEGIKKIYLESCQIPKSWYTIMTGVNDTIPFTAGSSYTATLTEGVYAVADLATEVASAMNTAYTPDNNFTCTVSTLTKKITITHSATTFTLDFTTTAGSAASTLGFADSDTSSGLSQEADGIYNLNYDTTLFVYSNSLGTDYFRTPQYDRNILYVMPVRGGFGDFMTYENQGGHWHIEHQHDYRLSYIDLSITFARDGTFVPFNGLDVRFTFAYETDL